MADLIVIGGCSGVQKAAGETETALSSTFDLKLGRTDATEEQTDGASFRVLEPTWYVATELFENRIASRSDAI